MSVWRKCWAMLPPAGRLLTAAQLCRVPTWQFGEHWASHTPLLVLDGLGLEPKPELCEELVLHRCSEDLTTLMTTRLSLHDFGERYEELAVLVAEVGAMVACETRMT